MFHVRTVRLKVFSSISSGCSSALLVVLVDCSSLSHFFIASISAAAGLTSLRASVTVTFEPLYK